MNNSANRLGKLLRIPLIVCCALQSSGCLLLFLDTPTGYGVECFVTVINPDGQEVQISSLTHPDFVFEGENGEVALQQLVVTTNGSTCPTGDLPPAWAGTIGEIEDKWRLWVGQRIVQMASGGPLDSDFRIFQGPWCEKPDSLYCEQRENVFRDPERSGACDAPAIDGPAPEQCPGARPVACLEISCGGQAPCDAVDFRELPVGELLDESVVMSNCGSANDPAVEVAVDWSVFVTGSQGDFAVVNNGCLPDPGDPGEEEAGVDVLRPQEACSFDVEFRPSNFGQHNADLIFGSSVEAQHRIALSGIAQAGALSFRALLPTQQDPAQLCFDTLEGACTNRRGVAISNDGPGVVRIDDVRIEPEDTGFVLWSFGPELPIPVPDEGVSLSIDDEARVRVSWCGDGASADTATLFIDSNGAPPAHELPLVFDPDGCP